MSECTEINKDWRKKIETLRWKRMNEWSQSKSTKGWLVNLEELAPATLLSSGLRYNPQLLTFGKRRAFFSFLTKIENFVILTILSFLFGLFFYFSSRFHVFSLYFFFWKGIFPINFWRRKKNQLAKCGRDRYITKTYDRGVCNSMNWL